MGLVAATWDVTRLCPCDCVAMMVFLGWLFSLQTAMAGVGVFPTALCLVVWHVSCPHGKRSGMGKGWWSPRASPQGQSVALERVKMMLEKCTEGYILRGISL